MNKLKSFFRLVSFSVFLFCSISAYAENDFVIPTIKKVQTSSFAGEKYVPENISDLTYLSWVEGASGDGCGEWIEFQFEKPVAVNGFSVKNGFGNLAYFWSNNRVKEAHVVLDDDVKHSVKVTFEDTPVVQYVYLNNPKTNKKTHSKFKLVIDSVYPGTGADNDTCISEILVNGFFNRENLFDAYYETSDSSFVDDPETKRMFRSIYEMDVGKENVKENDKGQLLVKNTDYETGEEYWVHPNSCLYGTQFHGYDPGTGGGSSKNLYKVYLQPDGRHILFRYYSQYYGVEEYFDSRIKVYVWENKAWKDISKNWNEPFLKPLNDFKKLIEGKGFVYNIVIKSSNYEYSDDENFTFIVYNAQYPRDCIDFSFDEKDYKFSDYKKDIYTVAALGKPEDFKNSPELLSGLKADLSDISNEYYKISPLNVAAMLNPDPAMCEYLIQFGYPVGKTGKYNNKVSALEAWNNGNNNTKVRDVLIKKNASYSSEMLISAVRQNDKKAYSELLGQVQDYGAFWTFMCDFYIGNYQHLFNLENFKFYISELAKTGFDLNKDYFDEQGRDCGTIMEEAIKNFNFDAVQYLYSAGVKIPEEFKVAIDGRTPVELCVYKYIHDCANRDEDESGYYSKKYDEDAKTDRKMLDLLLSYKVELNTPYNRPLNLLAENSSERYIKADLEMAELLIQKGVDVNALDRNGYNALETILYKNRGLLSEQQEKLADLFVQKGCLPEYAILTLIKCDSADAYLKRRTPDDYRGDKTAIFEKYLKLCKGRNVKKIISPGVTKDYSVLNEYLDNYVQSSEDDCYDLLFIKLFNAGFKFVDEKGLTEKVFYKVGCDIDKNKLVIYKKYFNDIKPDKNECSKELFSLTSNFRRGICPETGIQVMELLILHGADVNFESYDYWLNLKGNVSTAGILLYPKKEFFEIEDWVSDYIKVCRLFIKNGAKNILTEKALKKAKVPKNVITEILGE